ncbi:MAG: 30S ribosome-binding factor RbfA [Abditibacteriaceae bacterium]
MSTTFRSNRVAGAIRETVATALLAQIKDPRLANVTITRCEVTPDLSYVKIYYTVLGNETKRENAKQGFESATPYLRTQVGQEIPLRVVPELSFRYDEGTDNAIRIEELLSGLPELKKE